MRDKYLRRNDGRYYRPISRGLGALPLPSDPGNPSPKVERSGTCIFDLDNDNT